MPVPHERGSLSSAWALRADLAWARLLLALVAVPQVTTPKPEVHYFLFDRYFRLSELHRAQGAHRRARRLALRAQWHLDRSGLEPPPPAAVALPLPRRPVLTWAVAGRPLPPEPPDAA